MISQPCSCVYGSILQNGGRCGRSVSEYTDDFTGYIPVFMAVAFHWRANYVKAHGMISQPCSCVYGSILQNGGRCGRSVRVHR